MSYPLPLLVDGLVGLVDRVAGPEDAQCLDVLAACYVAAVDLRARGGLICGTVGKRAPEPIVGMLEALAEVRGMDRCSVDLAYAALIRALLGIERALLDGGIDAEAEGSFVLNRVWSGGLGLDGTVRWWVRPRSLWSAVLEGDESRTRRMIYGLSPKRLLRRIGIDWDRDGSFGGEVICRLQEGDPFGVQVQRVRDRPLYLEAGLRVVLHPLPAGLWPWFHLVPLDGRLVVDLHPDRYNDPEAVERALAQAIGAARAKRDPQMLIFPELMVDEAVRPRVQDGLVAPGGPLLAVFAGSAHVTLADGRRVSQALVLDPDGQPWWAHHKRGSFRCMGSSIAAARRAGRMFVAQEVPVHDEEPYYEAFAEGTCLRFCDTGLGRLVVLVCSDLLDDQAWSGALDRLEPDFLIVVSMSDRAGRFLERAKALAEERRVSVFYVNAGCEARVADDEEPPDRDVLAFVHLAVDDAPGRPTRVCWRSGRGLEFWDRKSSTWKPLLSSGYGLDEGAMWVDLGVFLSK